ncbi:Diacylglycerol kinase (EC 2.7.1.107) [uncultured Gammaproteobacteria bacterium]|jgi:diacylglycerol kinase (ATP)|uniref:Diacylglycerol kinase (EC) n=4 Tax=sulfur-oxidizing symbionts TaxID=32036 RepID=A0ACA8ZS20_9GAMM|nr:MULTISPECIES: diacylglycerol kinase [sulfur-oxidizing symbionts]CAC9509896.1 Diacylglycerol kinase (EC 2.7.1.107) [uncultured Gammaproteobacteria bacterium]CAB5505626.1 Diacylglycerol kinase (EC [Bathymodiolus azoricus thioautotrophic gill symbiont]CAB5508250.1 Diacylglycerol kinase (EC [Bathymodiolus thermophilus thioautotrophic gill symbiont]CAC9510362.1 Diacylglycerol kinase (EC 2.7.1.107) [uncultured Gammaproteobacteria bacterium]CAC9510795.1 Diacylglycerol kinase (EC 2.7.1.107) [uncult
MKNEATGLKRISNAFGFSMQGLKICYQSEVAFRQELWFGVVLISLAFWLKESAIERVLLIAPVFLVLIVEVLNSAIESVVDRIGDEYHALSGAAKDMGSAAVWLSLVLVLITWIIILI